MDSIDAVKPSSDTELLQGPQWIIKKCCEDEVEPHCRKHEAECGVAVCVREDGRVLCLEADEYRPMILKDDSRNMLTAMASGLAVQVDRDTSNSSVKPSQDVPKVKDSETSSRMSLKSSSTSKSRNANHPRNAGGVPRPSDKIPKYAPPCYCISCSRNFWLPTSCHCHEFCTVIEPSDAQKRVSKWLSNVRKKASIIASGLEEHGDTLHRIWSKKTAFQRLQILQRACPDLMSHRGLAHLIGQQKTPGGQKAIACEYSALLTSTLNMDDLSASDDLLFHHLRARSHIHASAHFLKDWHFVHSATLLSCMLQLTYVFGSFDVGQDQYGSWRKWNDAEIHNFRTVAGPHAFLVFESQSRTVNALYDIFKELLKVKQLQLPTPDEAKDTRSPPEIEIRLPTLADAGSLFDSDTPSTMTNDAVLNIAAMQREVAIDALKLVKCDNKAFVERVKSCQALLNANQPSEYSGSSMLAYTIFLDPYDRAIAWDLIHTSAEKFKEVYDGSRDKDVTISDHLPTLKTLATMLVARFWRLKQLTFCFCRNLSRPAAVMPSTLWAGCSSVHEWWERFFFKLPIPAGRIHYQQYLQHTLEQNRSDVLQINHIVKDWMEEGLTITRLMECLMGCLPTFHPDAVLHDPAKDQHSLWHQLYPYLLWPKFEPYLEDRGGAMKFALYPVAEYCLPTGPRNAQWYEKDRNARLLLRETWAECSHAIMQPYMTDDSPSQWVASIRQIVAATETESLDIQEPGCESVLAKRTTRVSLKTPVVSTIPHLVGPDSPIVRNITKAKLRELQALAQEDDLQEPDDADHVSGITASKDVDSDSRETDDLQAAPQIPVKKMYIEVAQSLLNSAQEQVSAVRWTTFLNFMVDAGCEVKFGEGVAVSFTGNNIHTGQRAAVVIHKGHPDTSLRAVLLRNHGYRFRQTFGWEASMFVARK